MSTTAIVVEILIIGFQVLIWVLLIFLDFFGLKMNMLSFVRENPVVSILFVTFISYSIGIVFDSFIAWVFSNLKLDRHLYHKTHRKTVIDILFKNPELHKFLDNQYARYRIVRATLFNLPIITVVLTISIILCYRNEQVNAYMLGLFVFIAGSILTLITYRAWKARLAVYNEYLEKAYERTE